MSEQTSEQESRDLSLSEIWTVLENAGATVHEWCENGVSTGVQVIRLGESHFLTDSESDGFDLVDFVDEDDLVATEDYDDDDAVRAASNTDGWFGIVGKPGEAAHDFAWFADRGAARAWVQRRHDAAIDRGCLTLPTRVVSAADALEIRWLDGNRIYFEPNSRNGFQPIRSLSECE